MITFTSMIVLELILLLYRKSSGKDHASDKIEEDDGFCIHFLSICKSVSLRNCLILLWQYN